ncbi:MAG: substrate-binding domain-containing protein [Chloroflexota bacterium]
MKRFWQFGFFALLALFLVACRSEPASSDLILATTTSTQDSGLLDVLLPVFEQDSGYEVKTVAVGSGQAIQMGEEGNADVLLVHAPAAEVAFMEKGFGAQRMLVMHNDFIVVGPAADLAGLQGASSAADALQRIAASQALFISRGDDSGTHKKELALWQAAGLTPEGDWYQESGQGMGATLKIASEKGAYTLADRATYLANLGVIDLQILVEGDAQLLNVYHVITVNPEKWPEVNQEGAKAFADFLVSEKCQKMIAEFGAGKFGQPLFTADAGKDESQLGLP